LYVLQSLFVHVAVSNTVRLSAGISLTCCFQSLEKRKTN